MSYNEYPIMMNKALNKSGEKHKLKLTDQNFSFKKCKIALGKLGMYYTWRNVSASYTLSGKKGYNNNSFGYYWDGVFYPVVLPEGFYDISDISRTMQVVTMFQNGHYMLDSAGKEVYFIEISANPTYNTATVVCSPVQIPAGGSNPNNLTVGSVPQLHVDSDNNFGLLIGFDAGNYPSASGTTTKFFMNGPNTPQITKVTNVVVDCDAAFSKKSNARFTIYMFSPQKGYAQFLEEEPKNLMYVDLADGHPTEIELTFKDQSGEPLDILDDDITVMLFVREPE